MDPRHTKIPEEPDQSQFLDKWFQYHRCQLTPELSCKDTSPGHLPALDPRDRLLTIRGRRRVETQQEHASIDETLDSLLEEASSESAPRANVPGPPRDVRSLPLRSAVPTLEQIRESQQRINEASRRRQQLAREMAAAEGELRTARQQHTQLTRERRTAQNLERVFGTREEIMQQGASYVSPLRSMYERAYDRYRVAEEVRAEERFSNENVERQGQLVQGLTQQRHGADVFLRDDGVDETLQGRLQSLDDERIQRPRPLTEDEMTVKLICKICLQQRAEVAVLPCGHLIMCSFCSEVAIPSKKEDRAVPMRRNTPCPLCRTVVKRLARVYTA